MNSLEHPECTSVIRHRGLAQAAEKVGDSSRARACLGRFSGLVEPRRRTCRGLLAALPPVPGVCPASTSRCQSLESAHFLLEPWTDSL